MSAHQPGPDATRSEALQTLQQIRQAGDALSPGGAGDIPSESEAPDAAELWGRRVGRVLAVVAAIAAVLYLYDTYVR